MSAGLSRCGEESDRRSADGKELRPLYESFEPGTDLFRENVRSALLDIKNTLLDVDHPLTRLIAK